MRMKYNPFQEESISDDHRHSNADTQLPAEAIALTIVPIMEET